MFLREVSPQFIHEDFLDCFLQLPNSFFAPKAPEKFQEFIERYGTHYVKGAKFGGYLHIKKSKRKSEGMTINDIRDEAVSELEEIAGTAGNHMNHNQDNSAAAGGASGSASGSGESGFISY